VLIDSDEYPPSESDFYLIADTMHGYPATKVQWQPAAANTFRWGQHHHGQEMLATVGDALRVWEFSTDPEPQTTSYVGRPPPGPQGRLSQKIALTGVSFPFLFSTFRTH
jgi:WD repeat-containing protein 68